VDVREEGRGGGWVKKKITRKIGKWQMKNEQTNGPKNHAKQVQRNNYKIARPLRFVSERAWSWTKLLRA